MRIAVSGATGFIGQHVLREMRARGIEPTAITRRPPQSCDSTTSEWVVMDIANHPPNPFEAMGRPDVLVHLAWGGLPNYQSDHHVETELPAQLEFLTSCIRGGLRRLVVTGTCYEYGLLSGKLTEDLRTEPCTQYGIAKDTLRKELIDLKTRYDFNMAWLRLFYTFGEGQSEKSLHRMLRAAIDQGASTFDMSGGDQLRDFLPIEEVARIIAEIALREDAMGVINVCSGRPTSIRDLAQSWVEELGATITLNFGRLPYSPQEPMDFWGDRRKLDSILADDA